MFGLISDASVLSGVSFQSVLLLLFSIASLLFVILSFWQLSRLDWRSLSLSQRKLNAVYCPVSVNIFIFLALSGRVPFVTWV
ncbi:MAG: hypothetical protein AAGA97_03800 [Pseudomonadota bacterium]